jgi:hypothetical protein
MEPLDAKIDAKGKVSIHKIVFDLFVTKNRDKFCKAQKKVETNRRVQKSTKHSPRIL